MNWENYSRLTNKQKEEYNYRFKERETFHIGNLMVATMNLFLVVVVLLFLSYLVVTMPALEQYKSQVSLYVQSAGAMLLAVLIFVIGYIVDFVVRLSWHSYQYYKWKKENKIVIITWWSRWRK
jgi:magnesium-transporting ATPase (P-type)